MQIFVAYESGKPVWFDDLKITHQPALVVQENHYYPFGMNIATLEKQGVPEHKFQYNGKEMQSEFGLDWLDYGARFYDPQLGRWHAVDPLSDEMRRHSTYNYAFDNPIMFIDPDGMMPDPPVDLGDYYNTGGNYWQTDNGYVYRSENGSYYSHTGDGWTQITAENADQYELTGSLEGVTVEAYPDANSAGELKEIPNLLANGVELKFTEKLTQGFADQAKVNGFGIGLDLNNESKTYIGIDENNVIVGGENLDDGTATHKTGFSITAGNFSFEHGGEDKTQGLTGSIIERKDVNKVAFGFAAVEREQVRGQSREYKVGIDASIKVGIGIIAIEVGVKANINLTKLGLY